VINCHHGRHHRHNLPSVSFVQRAQFDRGTRNKGVYHNAFELPNIRGRAHSHLTGSCQQSDEKRKTQRKPNLVPSRAPPVTCTHTRHTTTVEMHKGTYDLVYHWPMEPTRGCRGPAEGMENLPTRSIRRCLQLCTVMMRAKRRHRGSYRCNPVRLTTAALNVIIIRDCTSVV